MTAPWVVLSATSGPAWGILSSIVSTVDDGVDFRLLARENYPIIARQDRPAVIYDVHPEGTP